MAIQTLYDTEPEKIPLARFSARAWTKQLRIHQWVKNFLVFVPFVVTWQQRSPRDLLHCALVFVAFCFVASAVYIGNDIIDRDRDRSHPTKRFRPIAAGIISVRHGVAVAAVLATAGMGLAASAGFLALGTLLIYLVATIAYSMLIKRLPIADVILLAGLYTVRVIAGCAALVVVPSIWLLLFSVFVFFSLALMKRCADLVSPQPVTAGRGYLVEDAGLLTSLGTGSGLVSVLVLGLYINSLTGGAQYQTPLLLWLLIPTLLFWLSRAWLLTGRGGMSDDPVVFALTDPTSRVTGAVMVVIAVAATVFSL